MNNSTRKDEASGWRHRAFLSYSQADKKHARKLQKWLESYKLPKAAMKRTSRPRKFGTIFRDETDLSGAADLGDALKSAIDSSEALIVLCSPNSAQSEWVDREIQHFKKTGRGQQVFAVILDGEPNSQDPKKECFPPSFRPQLVSQSSEMPVEPLAVNPNAEGHLRAFTRLAASLFEVGFDDLWRREQRRQRGRMLFAGSMLSIGVFLSVAASVGGWLALQGFADVAQVKSDVVAAEAREIFASEQGDHTKSMLMALQADPAAQRDRIRTFFDGRTGYSAANTQLIRAYANNALNKVVRLETDRLNSTSFMPDGDAVLVSSVGWGTGLLIDIETGNTLQMFERYTDDFGSTALSSDGTLFAGSLATGGALVWNVETGEQVAKFTGIGGRTTLAFWPDGSRLMIGDEDGEVTLWDITLQTELVSVRHSSADRSIDQLAISPDGDRMATATSGGEVILWDVSRLSNDPEAAITQDSDRPLIPAVLQLRGDGAGPWPKVSFLLFSDDNGRLFIGDRNGGLSQVSASSGSQLDGPTGANRTPIAVSADGTRAFMLSSIVGLSGEIWDLEMRRPIRAISGAGANIASAAFSPDGTQLATSLQDGAVRIWAVDKTSAPSIETRPGEPLKPSISLTVTRDKRNVGQLVGASGVIMSSIELPADEQLIGHSFSPDETRLITRSWAGSEAGPIRIWDVATANLLHEIPRLPKPDEYTPSPSAREIAFAPDGSSFAAAFDYGTIRIYDAETSALRLVLEGHGTGPGGEHDRIGQFKDILSIEFNASGDRLVSTGRDKTVRIWDTVTGQPLNTFELGQHPIAAISTDGQLLATSDLFDGGVQVWDLQTSSDLVSFQHPVGRLIGLRFSADQSGIIVTNDKGAWRLDLPDIFNMAPKERVRVACNRLRDIGASMRFAKSDQFAHAALGGEPEDLGAEGQSFASPCPDIAE